jgi:hypothetical protein
MTDTNFKKLVAKKWKNAFNNDDERNECEACIDVKLIFFRSNKYELTSYEYNEILFLDKLDKLFIELCNTQPTNKDYIKPIYLINKILKFSDRYHIETNDEKFKPIIIYNHHALKKFK